MNMIRANFTLGSRRVITQPLWQYDYGQLLKITGLELPESYEVHFSNTQDGTATTSLGNSDGVEIPDIYLTRGDVFAWLYLHTGENDGETVYQIEIPVMKRASISNQPPTPVQQDVITQAIAALNAGVSEVEGIAEQIHQTIDTALAEAKASGEFDGKDGQDGYSPIASVSKSGSTATITITDANGTTTAQVTDGTDGQDGTDGVTFTPSVSSDGVISWSNDGGQQNPPSVDIVAAVINALPTAVGVSF